MGTLHDVSEDRGAARGIQRHEFSFRRGPGDVELALSRCFALAGTLLLTRLHASQEFGKMCFRLVDIHDQGHGLPPGKTRLLTPIVD